MKKLTIATVVALALTTPAVADTVTNDDPFVSTQGSLVLAGTPGLAAIASTILILGIAAAGDT